MLLTLTRPDDWHLHLRDHTALAAVLPHTARCFARAIVMPNLKPPITTIEQAKEYRWRILDALPPGMVFEPLMTLYLTDKIQPQTIIQAKQSGIIFAAKLYPAGATTNADQGVTSLDAISAALEAMQDCDLPLLVHGEVTTTDVDIFDREKIFIEQQLTYLLDHYPRLRIVFEHITTKEAVDFVRESPSQLAATITPHHLLYNRNAIFQGGIHPHFYCLPVLKREHHRQALIEAATSGDPRFFLGTDSAPHAQNAKEQACGCAGCYSAHAAIELYAEAFEQVGALERLDAFAGHFGADFYRLPRNQERITLEKTAWQVPTSYPFGDQRLIPLRAGETIHWHLSSES